MPAACAISLAVASCLWRAEFSAPRSATPQPLGGGWSIGVAAAAARPESWLDLLPADLTEDPRDMLAGALARALEMGGKITITRKF